MFINVFINRKRGDIDAAAYAADSARMMQLAQTMPGFISYRRFTGEDGEGLSISEWETADAALAWRRHPEHAAVQAKGRAAYYDAYTTYCCTDPRISHFAKGGE